MISDVTMLFATQKELESLKLKGKPKCPFCRKPLNYVYEGTKGMTGEKCKLCGNSFLVNTETLKVSLIPKST